MAEPTIRAEHLVKTFGTGRAAVRAVDEVSLEVEHGELVVVMGPSGSGKTTLVSMLGALLTPDSGSIHLEGTDLTQLDEKGLATVRAEKIGFIFQSFNLLEALTVEQNVLFPAHLTPRGIESARTRAAGLLDQLGLSARRTALPKTLSGGEQQRVAIARAIAKQPEVLLCDEPTGALDSKTGVLVLEALTRVNQDLGTTTALITHNAGIQNIAHRVISFIDGRVAEEHRNETRISPSEVVW